MVTKPRDPDDVQLSKPAQQRRPYGTAYGDPAGVAAKKQLKAATRMLALEHSEKAMGELIAIMQMWRTAVVNVGTSEDPRFEVDAKILGISRQAAVDVLNYGVGRPGVQVTIEEAGDTKEVDPVLAALLALANKKGPDADPSS